MEEKLRKLFDYQCLVNNRRLAQLITEAENRYKKEQSKELGDDELDFVNAAGELDRDKVKKVTDNNFLN